MTAPVVVDPARWPLPPGLRPNQGLVGDPSRPGVWFVSSNFRGHQLTNVTSLAPLDVRSWTLDPSALLGGEPFFPRAMAAHDATLVLFAQGRTVLRYDAAAGAFVDSFPVAHPAQAEDTSKMAPRESVAAQVIEALAIDHAGSRLALASDYATAIQIVDLNTEHVVEIPLPERTAAYQMGWTTGGTLVVGMNNVGGWRGGGNVFLVRAGGETQQIAAGDNSVVYTGDVVVTSAPGHEEAHVIDDGGAMRTVPLQSVSGARPRGFGLGGSRTMIANGLTDGTLAVFDWEGNQRATVLFDEQPRPMGSRPASLAFACPEPQGPWYPQVDSVVSDATGQVWFLTNFPTELAVLPADLI